MIDKLKDTVAELKLQLNKIGNDADRNHELHNSINALELAIENLESEQEVDILSNPLAMRKVAEAINNELEIAEAQYGAKDFLDTPDVVYRTDREPSGVSGKDVEKVPQEDVVDE